MEHKRSDALYCEAQKYIPGGVNSPVRAFSSAGCSPLFITHASGSHVYDVDQQEYIDYICSWGPMILGHAHPKLCENLQEVIERGISYGLCTPLEITLAQMICEAYQGVDMVRMVNSGTEATMSCIRVARGYTKRDKIIKFEGCYHGHSDGLLVKSGSGALTFQTMTSPGVPYDIVKHTLVCTYNDIRSVETCIKANRDEIACIIIEPIAANMGVIPGEKVFLQQLRELCTKHNIVLIFDEVITGFRIAYGGASEYYGIQPDMACFGKIIGGGLPVGAYGGRRDIMQHVSPAGDIYQAGTLSGNPLAMELGIRQLGYLKDHPNIYQELEAKAQYLKQGVDKILCEQRLPYQIQQCGSLLTLFFTNQEIHNYQDIQHLDTHAFQSYFQYLLNHHVLVAPSPYEAMFLSTAHSYQELDQTLHVIQEALLQI